MLINLFYLAKTGAIFAVEWLAAKAREVHIYRENMKVEFKNIGPIKQMSYDFSKKLTLITGPNGTGKTYAANALYGLMDSVNRLYLHSFRNMNLFDSLEKLSNDNITFHDNVTLIKFENEKVKDLHRILTYLISQHFMRDSEYMHGGDIKSRGSKIDLDFNLQNEKQTKEYHHDINFIGKTDRNLLFKCNVKITQETNGSILISIDDNINDKVVIDKFYGDLSKNLISFFINPHQSIQSRFFPVERNATTLFSKEISLYRNEFSNSIASLEEKDLKEFKKKVTQYSRPVLDNIQMSENLNTIKQEESKFAFLADEIEENILKGKLSINEDGALLFSPKSAENLTLSINVSASAVKSIALLIVYLRHEAREGDYIIIDEPELNLHPDNQIRMAHVLARLANEGFHIIACTHSDYIVRELNNLILAEERPNKWDEVGYKENMVLDYKDMDVIYLNPTGFAENMQGDEEGFEVPSMDKASYDINKHTKILYSDE